MCVCTFMCTSRSKIDVDRKKMREKKGEKRRMNKKEKRTDEPQRCITHYAADLLIFIFIFVHFHNLSFFLLPYFSSFFSCACVTSHIARRKDLLFFSSSMNDDNDNGLIVVMMMMMGVLIHLPFPSYLLSYRNRFFPSNHTFPLLYYRFDTYSFNVY